MTDAEIAQVDLEGLTQSEKAALTIVTDMAAGRHTGAERLARYCIDREEGKVPDHHIVENGDNNLKPLEPDEKEQLQKLASQYVEWKCKRIV